MNFLSDWVPNHTFAIPKFKLGPGNTGKKRKQEQ